MHLEKVLIARRNLFRPSLDAIRVWWRDGDNGLFAFYLLFIYLLMLTVFHLELKVCHQKGQCLTDHNVPKLMFYIYPPGCKITYQFSSDWKCDCI